MVKFFGRDAFGSVEGWERKGAGVGEGSPGVRPQPHSDSVSHASLGPVWMVAVSIVGPSLRPPGRQRSLAPTDIPSNPIGRSIRTTNIPRTKNPINTQSCISCTTWTTREIESIRSRYEHILYTVVAVVGCYWRESPECSRDASIPIVLPPPGGGEGWFLIFVRDMILCVCVCTVLSENDGSFLSLSGMTPIHGHQRRFFGTGESFKFCVVDRTKESPTNAKVTKCASRSIFAP